MTFYKYVVVRSFSIFLTLLQVMKKPSFKECFELCASAMTKLFSFFDNIFQVQFSEDGTKLFFTAVREGSGVGLFYIPTDSGMAGGVNVVGCVCVCVRSCMCVWSAWCVPCMCGVCVCVYMHTSGAYLCGNVHVCV